DLIAKIQRSDTKRKGSRSPAAGKQIVSYLKKFADRESDNIYGKAAAFAAEKASDPKHSIASAGEYVQRAQ
ncbi:MAG: hypothetical protein AAF517_21600, partial [Planctomycetota bacterium]